MILQRTLPNDHGPLPLQPEGPRFNIKERFAFLIFPCDVNVWALFIIFSVNMYRKKDFIAMFKDTSSGVHASLIKQRE